MKKVLVVLLIIFSLSLISVQAQESYQLTLLAVQETGIDLVGSTANLVLEIRPGTGRVFLETTPLTKLDTQISAKFAKDIACSQFTLPCNQYDFLYSIEASSNIIGGPSAGAALAALTTIAILDLPYDESIALTGTINSGGIIGPVGGVKEKLEVAAASGITHVLIPQGSTAYHPSNESNATLDLVRYGNENLSVEVTEVIDLAEIITLLTGRELIDPVTVVAEDQVYTQIMDGLRNLLCQRSLTIEELFETDEYAISGNTSVLLETRKEQAANATVLGDYYSAASFCFGANILLKTEYYQQLLLDPFHFNLLERKIESLQEEVDREPITTLADLQTYMIVSERLHDARSYIDRGIEATNNDELAALLAYAEERYFSALSWMQFFSMDGQTISYSAETVQNTCAQKIFEARERHQYASLFVGELVLINIFEKIGEAEEASSTGEYALCLITATQAKAEANAVLSSFGLQEDRFASFVTSKRQAVERIIAQNSAEGIFPILGYSYYQYSTSLQDSEPFTTLVYLEYALEMSDLDIYFPREQVVEVSAAPFFDEDSLLTGIVLGVLLMLAFWWVKDDVV